MIGDKEKKIIEYRLPLFGQIEVTLHEESKILYEVLEKRGEIERLKQIEHLGVLHKVFESPIYTRWAYVMTILYLIEEAKDFINIRIGSDVTLDKEIEISSGGELLKCWALLLFTGHLPGTFSTERALLKRLQKEDNCKALFEDKIDAEKLQSYLERIVKEENLFHVFYILTTYKTLKIKKEFYRREKEYYDNLKKEVDLQENKLSEILKAFLLVENYYSGVSRGEIEKGEKLKRLVEYFKSFRELAFIILDGYYAQVSLNLNPLYIVKNLDEMTDDGHLKTLIDDIQKYFYNTIYHSQEGITSHLYYSNQFLKLFNKYEGTKQLIEDLCDNKIDGKIQKLMKEGKNQYKHFIRVKFGKEEIKGFLTEEKGMLDKSGVCDDKRDEDIIFGITFNPPTNEYYGDICCKNLKKNLNECVGLVAEEVKKFKEENVSYVFHLRLKFLAKLMEKDYSNLDEIDEEELKKFEGMKDADEIAEALEVKEEETPERILNFLNQIFSAIFKEWSLLMQEESREKTEEYFVKEVFGKVSSDIEPLSKLYERREPVACDLAERVFELVNEQIKTGEMMLEFLSKPRNNFKAFFTVHYKELGSLCEYIKKKMEKTLENEERETRDLKNELKSLINELEEELKNEENKNFYYVVVPSIKFNDVSRESKEHSNIRGDLDGLYIKIPKDTNARTEMIVIEAKRRGHYRGKQIKRVIEIIGEEISDKKAREIAQSLVRGGRYENTYVNIKKLRGRGYKYVKLQFKI